MKEPTKAILVIDMPECCLDCPCSYTYGYRIGTPTSDICEVVDRKLSKENMNDKKPDWCPLKPLPQKNKYYVEEYATFDYENNITLGHYLNKGWNACLEEITGEKE